MKCLNTTLTSLKEWSLQIVNSDATVKFFNTSTMSVSKGYYL